MYVCICNQVSDKDIKASIQEGATTMRALYKEHNIGSQCGKCCQCAKKLLNNELIKIAETQYQVA
ncbi:bacterioferritin [Marinomonas primoryensis]|jgi:bacterioferritin-associated ferredoxin|uniref:Bacterioferritin-associated ferredoxin n=2 Tax=Marinomonas TaxID=28253 RepID=A0A2Z4PV72_9GAMM|nr:MULTISPECIES: (2Fe-2S)-binding protein [Marinomonas]AWY01297.1 bacterioferritin [Marinomonas primoryensis]MDE8602405.1 (2Fe-2S)-binding protein [Marinomonas maritima]QKK80108.1 bacterioferritin-associated ferredoxin [Marinomonas primoryensis]